MYYKVLIVDDEKKIRDGLSRIVKWDELGFELAGEACNGLDALEFIKNNQCPHVILTDIRMPIMDGLEMIQEIKKCGYNTHFIILSGYDYFEYAKKAIELGAFDYILKPTRLNELKSKFLKLKEKIDNDIKKNMIIDKGTGLIRENFIKDLIYHNYGTVDEIMEKMRREDMFIGDSDFIVAVVRVFGNNKNIAVSEVKQKIDEFIHKQFAYFSCIDNNGNIVYIFIDIKINDESLSERNIESIAGTMRGIVKSYGIQAAIGIGNKLDGIDNIGFSYKQAIEALEKRFFRGADAIIKISSCKQESIQLNYPLKHEEQLILSIDEGNKAMAAGVIEELSANLLSDESLDPAQVRKVCIEMIVAVSRRYKNISCRIEDIFDEKRIIYKKLLDIETLHQLKDWFKERIFIVIDLILDIKDNNNSRIVNHIKKIISEKYYDQIMLTSIADSLYMNSDYLSRLFKKETGQSFVDFLTDFRVEKAKELLKDVSNKSYEVGLMVGYQDASYFSKIFKKVTGKSISEYRGIN